MQRNSFVKKLVIFPDRVGVQTFIAIDLTQKTSNLVTENVHQKALIFNPLIFELMGGFTLVDAFRPTGIGNLAFAHK